MNAFKLRDKYESDLTNRATYFVRMAATAISSLCGEDNSSDACPEFIESYHGFAAEVFPFDNSRWVDNPNYKPGLTSEEYAKPENLAVDAGFNKIEVVDKLCLVRAIELQDPWDDCAGEPETWQLHSIPQELFLSGTEQEILEFFKNRFKETVDRELENAHRSKWAALFYYYTPEELNACADAMTCIVAENQGQRFETLLEVMKGK